MKPHEERVVVEKRELDDKISKLKAFCIEPESAIFKGLSREECYLLKDQYAAMVQYSEILSSRIALFQKE